MKLNSYDIDENVIQWLNGDKYISCTFTQRKYINKVKKIMQRTPEFVPDFIENKDGSIYCKLPLKALKLSIIIRKEAENTDDEEPEEEHCAECEITYSWEKDNG